MTTSLAPSLREIADGGLIPESTRIFFRERLRVRLHQFLLREFAQRSRTNGLTRKALGERIEKGPELITRKLGTPSNMELDTLSDLLLAMGLEPTFGGREIVPAAEAHPADIDSALAPFRREAVQGKPADIALPSDKPTAQSPFPAAPKGNRDAKLAA